MALTEAMIHDAVIARTTPHPAARSVRALSFKPLFDELSTRANFRLALFVRLRCGNASSLVALRLGLQLCQGCYEESSYNNYE